MAAAATEARRTRSALAAFAALSFVACQRPNPAVPADAGPRPVAGGPASQAQTQTQTSTSPHSVLRSYRAMGTQITFTAFTAKDAEAVAAFDLAAAEFERLDELLSVWHPESEISRINQAAGKAPVRVSAETLDLLREARRFYDWSGRRFDPTFGALSGLWRFDHDQDNRIPDPKLVKARLVLVDYEKVKLDAAAGTVFLPEAGMRLHLGGLGKGHAVDRAVALLRARGFEDFMVQAGGDLYVAGQKGDRPFRVGIRDPRGPASAYFAFIELKDATFSTSGDYERFFVHDGRRYHHIIDVSTGEPSRFLRSATVMADGALLADGLSTVLMLLPPEEGLALVETLPGVGAVLVDAKNHVHVSKRLSDRVKILRAPTPGL